MRTKNEKRYETFKMQIHAADEVYNVYMFCSNLRHQQNGTVCAGRRAYIPMYTFFVLSKYMIYICNSFLFVEIHAFKTQQHFQVFGFRG